MKTKRWNTGDGMWLAAVGMVAAVAIALMGTAWGQEQAPDTAPAETEPATSQPVEAETAPSPPAEAPLPTQPAPQVDEKELAALWDNFLHGIKVAREDLAESTGRAILESGAARQVYLLSVKEGDVQWLLTRGERLGNLKPIIDDIRKMIEAGYSA